MVKLCIFPILRSSNIGYIGYSSPNTYLSFFTSLLQFLYWYWFIILVHVFFSVLLPIQSSLFDLLRQNSWRFWTLQRQLKEKDNLPQLRNLEERYLQREQSRKEVMNYTKKDKEKIKSFNFTRIIREKSIIAIKILKKGSI